MKPNTFMPKLAGVLLATCMLAGAAEARGKKLELYPVSDATKGTYQELCAECHGGDRLGGIGPALLPESLKRLRASAAAATIKEGRVHTQMPAFGDQLNDQQIADLVNMIKTPLGAMPVWVRRKSWRHGSSMRITSPLKSQSTSPTRSTCSWWWKPAITTLLSWMAILLSR